MRRLTVRNFSVIKDATIDFGKITVLIGPQASGKSLLCRLEFFFSQYLPEFANNVARRHPSFKELGDAIQSRFTDWFPVKTWSNQRAEIAYTSDSYSFSVSVEPLKNVPQFNFSADFSSDFANWVVSEHEKRAGSGDQLPRGPYSQNGSIYIPSGRIFYSTPNKGFVSASSKQLDWVTQRFSTEIDFEYRAMIASSLESANLLHEFGEQAAKILRGRVVSSSVGPQFQQASDSRILSFDFLSSGTVELLPLLNPISKLVAGASIPDYLGGPESNGVSIFVEEPESGLFPSSQYELMRLFAWLASSPTLDLGFVVTTHSPYILSAFNNLIEAGQVVRDHPELRTEVARIVPEQYWIKDGDFKAYSIHDGKLESILNESGFVEGNYLDQVSDVIEKEFDQLLRLEYDHTEAS
jgi:hypothetical protein